MQVQDLLNWRYATKVFNPEKKVSEKDLEFLKEMIGLTPSSFGLQPYKIQVISDENTKKALFPHTYNQKQIIEASHIFVFANFTELTDEYLEKFYRLKAATQGKEFKDFLNYLKNVSHYIKSLSKEQLLEYTALQTYMALETLLMAAPERKIDVCPIGGFIAEKYNDILEYDEKALNACVVAAVGYRSPEDSYQFLPKFRMPKEELFF